MTPRTTPTLIPVIFPDEKLFPLEDDDPEPAVKAGLSSDEVEEDTYVSCQQGYTCSCSRVLGERPTSEIVVLNASSFTLNALVISQCCRV